MVCGLSLNMKVGRLINAVWYISSVVGILLILMGVVAWRHGSLDLISATKSSLLDAEATLRGWFSSLHFH
jgi:hypothetical protein